MKYSFYVLLGFLCLGAARAQFDGELNRQLDFNGNNVLDYDEVIFGIKFQKGEGDWAKALKARQAPPADSLDTLREKEPRVYAKYVFVCSAGKALPGRPEHRPPFLLDSIPPEDLGVDKHLELGGDEISDVTTKYICSTNLKLRRSIQALHGPLKDTSTDPKTGQGALFSYGGDFNDETSQWIARGAIQYEWGLIRNAHYQGPRTADGKGWTYDPKSEPTFLATNCTVLQEINWEVLTTFDKVSTTNDHDNDINDLTFGTGVNGVINFPNACWINCLSFNADGNYATDFNFEKAIFAGTLDITPSIHIPFGPNDGFSTGMYQNWIPGIFCPKFNIYVHLEGGTVSESGVDPTSNLYDNFIRLGGGAEVDIALFEGLNIQGWKPFDKKCLVAHAGYYYYAPIIVEAPETEHFNASLQYTFGTIMPGFKQSISGSKNMIPVLVPRSVMWSMKVEYNNGRLPLTNTRDNTILAGIGVAF